MNAVIEQSEGELGTRRGMTKEMINKTETSINKVWMFDRVIDGDSSDRECRSPGHCVLLELLQLFRDP
jgi:hypothetical protein